MVDDPAPLVVAFSGGGDSLALLLAAKAWADRHGRRLFALTVDHRLRPEGAQWARWCRRRAERLGVRHETLVWEGDKPFTGRSAAARSARHRLLANATRDIGGGVILMGHTADDRAEASLMRQAGSTVPSPRGWTPSPAWPDGRGVFILRPLLDITRADLRAGLRALGESWIEDPANADPLSARARARTELTGGWPSLVDAPAPGIADLSGVVEGVAGDISIPREALARAAAPDADLGAAVLCAAGTFRPPRKDRLARLLEAVLAGEPFVATLAGARIEFAGDRVHIVRDAADHRRGEVGEIALPMDMRVIWDGRFEMRSREGGARVGHLAGHAARLPTVLRRAVLSLPAATRPALPLVTHADGRMECPTLCASTSVEIQALALARLAAARGAIVNEAAMRRMAKPARPS